MNEDKWHRAVLDDRIDSTTSLHVTLLRTHVDAAYIIVYVAAYSLLHLLSRSCTIGPMLMAIGGCRRLTKQL